MPEAGSRLIGSVKRLASTLTSIVSSRLELLGNELQEERLRLTQMFLYSLFAFFCFGMGLLLFTVFIVVLFWDDHRLVVLGGPCILFFVLGMLMAMVLRVSSPNQNYFPLVLPSWLWTGNNWVLVMNEKMFKLIERLGKLLARIAAQREQMADIGSYFRASLSLADRGVAVVHFLRFHPLLVAGVAAFFVIRRRSVAGLVWGVWRVWKEYRDFSLHSAKLLS
jgi:uncharacterized membrane protein YqjE